MPFLSGAALAPFMGGLFGSSATTIPSGFATSTGMLGGAQSAMGSIGGAAKGIGAGILSGSTMGLSDMLMGGGSSPQAGGGFNNQNVINWGLEQRQKSGTDAANPIVQGAAKTSSPILEPMAKTLERGAHAVTQQAMQRTGQVASRIGSAWLDNKIQGMFRPDPMKQGMRDRIYTNVRYPGTNPWEQLRGGGAPSMGGVTAAQIGTAGRSIGAHSQREGAHISAEAALKKAPSEIERNKAVTVETRLRSEWIPQLSQMKIDLDNSIQSKNSIEYNKILEDITHIQKEVLTQIQLTGLTKANKEQQQVYARILKPIRNSDDLAKLFLFLGTAGLIGTASRGLGGIGRTIASPFRKKKVLTNKSPKQWRDWRMQTGKVNKQTGELYP